MTLRPGVLGFALFLVACTTPEARPLDLRPAWACTVRTSNNDVALTVIRTLDANGEQFAADVQWSVGGFDGGRLSLMAMQAIKGAGDPVAEPRDVLVSWSGFSGRLPSDRLLIVLHDSERPPNVLDGAAMIPYLNGLIGAAVSWQAIAALMHNSHLSQLSLLDPRGRALRSAPIDLARLRGMVDETRAALQDTRAKAAQFERQCERVTEWMTL